MPTELIKNKLVIFTLSLILVSSSLLTAGCGSKYGPKTVKVNYYPECYQPIDDLRRAEEKLHKDMATGAAVGAATGLMVGLATSGNVRGALLGAGIGLVAGLAGSYLISSAMQEKALHERFQAYNTTIDAETSNLNIAVRFAKKTCDCYDAAYKKLKRTYQKGGMTKEEMLVRLKEIRDGNNDAIRVLQVFKADSVKHTETFAQVYRLEQNRSYDKAPKGTLSQLRKKQTSYDKAAKSTDDTIALITKRNSIVENDISDRERAYNGTNILALGGTSNASNVR